MSKRSRDVALVAGLACLVGVLSMFGNQLYASSRAKAAGQSITVITRMTANTKPAKVTLGQQFVTIFDVLDTSEKIIGKMVSTCAITGVDQADPTKTSSKCDYILQLPEGTIDLGGLLADETTPGSTNSMAVLGGTGTYRAVSGDAVLKSKSDKESNVTVNFPG